ncbi:MAG: NUDIX domain-containing protein [Desulfuromonadales bacterium]|nr:NUDIX domain-containing protein [Desulfuromonadales bacterium]
MNTFLVKIWKMLRGPLQWYILWVMHDKFIIGVSGVILNDRDEVLLLRHRYWKDGSWGLPSGYANSGEKMEDAIAREVYEETGYRIKTDGILKMTSGYKLRLELSYLARLTGGNLKLEKNEILEARFFEPATLPSGLLPSHKEIITLALSR